MIKKTTQGDLDMVWLLTICIHTENKHRLGVFHFRGYVKGQWISKVIVELNDENEENWNIGESYLLKLAITRIDKHGILFGNLKELKVLDFNVEDNWESY